MQRHNCLHAPPNRAAVGQSLTQLPAVAAVWEAETTQRTMLHRQLTSVAAIILHIRHRQ